MKVAIFSTDGIAIARTLEGGGRFYVYEVPGTIVAVRNRDAQASLDPLLADCGAVVAEHFSPLQEEDLLGRGILPLPAAGGIMAFLPHLRGRLLRTFLTFSRAYSRSEADPRTEGRLAR